MPPAWTDRRKPKGHEEILILKNRVKNTKNNAVIFLPYLYQRIRMFKPLKIFCDSHDGIEAQKSENYFY